jgi:hypothetical protein
MAGATKIFDMMLSVFKSIKKFAINAIKVRSIDPSLIAAFVSV